MLHCAMVAILAIRSDCLQQFKTWCCLKSFKIATMAVILDNGTEWFSNSESPFHPDASNQVSAQPDCLGGDVIWRISRWWPFWTLEQKDFSNSESLILNLYVASMTPIKFWLWPIVWEISFEEFQDGCRDGHLEYLNRRILAILNLCVTVMLPIRFWLNPTYGLGGDVIWRISRWRPRRPSWISEQCNFSKSESLCCSNASHHVLAQSHLWLGRRCHLKYFKMAAMVAILDMGAERF